jgi:hypothetical protein
MPVQEDRIGSLHNHPMGEWNATTYHEEFFKLMELNSRWKRLAQGAGPHHQHQPEQLELQLQKGLSGVQADNARYPQFERKHVAFPNSRRSGGHIGRHNGHVRDSWRAGLSKKIAWGA